MNDNSRENFIVGWFTIILLIIITCLIIVTGSLIAKSEKSKEEESGYYTYAIIFYPDGRTSVEGYVDKFVWMQDHVKVTINGEQYITSSENVVIVKRKDLMVNKENSE